MNYFDNINLNLESKGPLPRFFDQKVTPDVLATITYTINSLKKECFSNSEIQKSKFLADRIEKYYGKPSPINPTASNEYDKFVSQITNFLEYSEVILRKGKIFKIIDNDIISKLSGDYEYSLEFIISFLKKFILDNNLYQDFTNYLSKEDRPTTDDFNYLRDIFVNFCIKYTNISKPTEPRRIFGKFLNPLAYSEFGYGARHGRSSKSKIIYKDLMYHVADNSRDLKKNKGETRQEHYERLSLNKKIYSFMADAKKMIKSIHGNRSIVSKKEGVHIHHILPKSDFPQFMAYPENMVPLTQREHLYEAHPDNKTSVVDKRYQEMLIKLQREFIIESKNKLDINKFNEIVKALENK